MSPKIPRPQKRACDICYEKKIHCSIPNAEGPCEWCENRGLECTFDRERPRKRKRDSVKPSDVQNLLERVEQLEKALLQTQATPSTIFQDNSGADNATTSVQSEVRRSESTRLAEQRALTTTPGSFYSRDHSHSHDSNVLASQLGPNWFFSGIPISSEAGYEWLATRTGQNITGTEFSIPVKAIHPSSTTSSEEIGYLPDKNAVQKILSAFFDSSLKLSFPVLDEVLLEATLETAYESSVPPLSNVQISANACILSALALSPRFCFGTENVFVTDVEVFASKAYNLLNQVAGDTSLTLLEAALMLELRCVFDGHWLGAVPFHSIACRIVCSLSGNSTCNTDHGLRHIQKLFWLCYILDKDLSIRTGNPPLLTDTYCDPMPQDGPLDGQRINQVSELHGGFSEGVCLAILKEKACQLLFSARALRENDNKLLSSIRQLDDEIEHWRLSIPVNLRPALYVSQNALIEASNDSIPHGIRRLSLQLDYHHLMTVIHTTVRRCTTETEGTADLHHVVHSSFDLSLVASRSTLWCLKFLISNMAKEAYRMITFYSTTAAMALFLDIVIHPYSQQAQLDLELLISTANMVRSLNQTTLTTSEVDRVRETSSFVMRLVWLGTCAIMKGDRNERS